MKQWLSSSRLKRRVHLSPLKPRSTCLCWCDGLSSVGRHEHLPEVVPAVEHGAAAPLYIGEAIRVLLHSVLVVHLFPYRAHQVPNGVHLKKDVSRLAFRRAFHRRLQEHGPISQLPRSYRYLTTFWKYFMVIFQPSSFSKKTSYASRGKIPHSGCGSLCLNQA